MTTEERMWGELQNYAEKHNRMLRQRRLDGTLASQDGPTVGETDEFVRVRGQQHMIESLGPVVLMKYGKASLITKAYQAEDE